MTKRYANEFVGVLDGTRPASKSDGGLVRADLKVIRATIPLEAQASGDTIVIGKRPQGSSYFGHRILASATLATATIAIGTEAAAEKYRAAATFTTANTPTDVALASAVDDAPLDDEEEMIVTIGTAALPGAGTLIIETLYLER